ncbi:MAG TPA: hypothetical protein PLZ45_07675 [Ferruginibacter sp.]|nr:hypothetical protein [Ferruginibacter sp.]
MSLKFAIDNKAIVIDSFNKDFDKNWGSIFKVIGNKALLEIGLREEFYFKCDNAHFGTYSFQLVYEDGSRPLNLPANWQQSALFSYLRNFVQSGANYF